MGSIFHLTQWPQTACFNPLYKPLCGVVHFTKWGDYRNLALNASTSGLAWPPSVLFGHYDRTHIKKEAAFPKQASSCLSALVYVSQWVDTNTAKCRCLSQIVAWNAGTPGSSGHVCFWSKGIVRGNDMGWSGFLFWHLLKCCSIRHGFMSFQSRFGRFLSSRIMSNQTSSIINCHCQCPIVTIKERYLWHYVT